MTTVNLNFGILPAKQVNNWLRQLESMLSHNNDVHLFNMFKRKFSEE